jgi:hypothetical protein
LGFAPVAPVYPLWQFSNLRFLGLTPYDQSKLTREYLVCLRYFVRRCMVHFPRLHDLAVEYPVRGDYSQLIREINATTGVQGRGLGGDSFCGMVRWGLDTTSGQTLEWTDHLCSRSVPWKNTGIIYQHVSNIQRNASWRTYRTTSAGMICRRLPSTCYDPRFYTKLYPPPFICNCPVHDQSFTCGEAPNVWIPLEDTHFTRLIPIKVNCQVPEHESEWALMSC